MKQHWRRYLALFLCFNVNPRALVYGFAPLPTATACQGYISTALYSADVFGTSNVMGDKGDDVNDPPMNGASKQNTSKEKDMLLEDERSLYEILGASPDATRDELKKLYVKLARETHPDATVGLGPEERSEKEVLFTEVAAAWRILSDKRERQRYDRSLKAKEFTRNVERVAGDYADRVARTAAPAVSRVLESLFQSTTGPSAPSLDDAARQVRETRQVMRAESEVKDARRVKYKAANGKKVDVVTAIASAISNGRKFTQAINRYDLLNKSRELEQM